MSTTTKLDPAVFETAAEMLWDGSPMSESHAWHAGGCVVIHMATIHMAAFGEYFNPGGAHESYFEAWLWPGRGFGSYWYGHRCGPEAEKNREARALGLLLMAELVRDGQEAPV